MENMDIKIKKVENEEEFEKALNVRFRVFVDEQGVPRELERDEKDEEAIHVIAQNKDKTVGCGRIVFHEEKAKLGRLAVDKSWRQQGIGSSICRKLIKIAEKKGYRQIILHAQLHSVDFYKKLGFESIGNVFEEAGIDHKKMIHKIK